MPHAPRLASQTKQWPWLWPRSKLRAFSHGRCFLHSNYNNYRAPAAVGDTEAVRQPGTDKSQQVEPNFTRQGCGRAHRACHEQPIDTRYFPSVFGSAPKRKCPFLWAFRREKKSVDQIAAAAAFMLLVLRNHKMHCSKHVVADPNVKTSKNGICQQR